MGQHRGGAHEWGGLERRVTKGGDKVSEGEGGTPRQEASQGGRRVPRQEAPQGGTKAHREGA